MAGKRTKQQKIQTAKRVSAGFQIDLSSISTEKSAVKTEKPAEVENSFLRRDLTKTGVVSMLAVGSELALWWNFFR